MKLSDTVEAIPTPAMVVEPGGVICAANRLVHEALAAPPGRLVGRTIGDFLTPEGYAVCLRAVRADGPAQNLRIDGRRHDRRPIVLDVSVGPANTGGVLVLVRPLADGDAHTRALSQQARSEELAHVGSWEWDIPTGRMVWSDEVYRIFGLAPGEIVASHEAYLSIVDKRDREEVETAMAHAVATGAPYDREQRILRPDGEVRVTHARAELVRSPDGAPVLMLGRVLDITDRAVAERRLRERDAFVAHVQELAGIGWWDLDVATGEMECAPTLFELTGVEPDTHPRLPALLATVHRDDLEFLQAALVRAAASDEPVTVAYRIVNPAHGDERTLRISAQADRPGHLVGAVIDVTAEHASRTRLARAQQTAQLGSWDLDVATGALTWSDEMFRILGLDPARDKPSMSAYFDCLQPDERAAMEAHFREITETGTSGSREHGLVLPDGTEKTVRSTWEIARSPTGTAVSLSGTTQDVTARANAERRLRESSASLAHAQRMAHLGSWEWDIPTDALVWSDEVFRIFGRDPATLSPSYEKFLDFIHPEDRDAVHQAVTRTFETSEPYSIEHRVLRPDGEVRVVHEQGEVILAADGTPVRMAGVVLDVTERARAERLTAEVAGEQAALRRVATAVAAETGIDEVARLVAEEVGRLFDVGAVAVCRFAEDGAVWAGAWANTERVGQTADQIIAAMGPVIPFDSDTVAARVYRTGRTGRVGAYAGGAGRTGDVLSQAGVRSALGCPVRAGTQLWGALIALSMDSNPLPEAAEERLERFAQLVGLAIMGAESADRLRREHAEMAAKLAAIQDGYLVADPDHRIVEVNDRFCEMTGFPRSALIGCVPPYPFWDRDPQVDMLSGVQQTSTADACDQELPFRRADGTPLPVIASSRVLRDEAGRNIGSFGTFKDIAERKQAERDLAARAAEQAALGRVSRLVAEGPEVDTVTGLVAEEVGRLLNAEAGVVVHFDGGDTARVVASWDVERGRGHAAFTHVPLDGDSVTATIHRTGESARMAYDGRSDHSAHLMGLGYRAGVGAPIRIAGTRWGAVLALTTGPHAFRERDEARLSHFAELVSLAIANAQAEADLAARAITDGLTGLANHRAFREQMETTTARAVQAAAPLALILLDIDHFKDVNDTFGHSVGDRVVADVARRLLANLEPGWFAARVGGDELAILLPGATDDDAVDAARRLRAAISHEPFEEVGTLTISCGVCTLDEAGAGDLYQLADGALYWAKATGRDRVVLYSPDVVMAVSAKEHAEHLDRVRVLSAIQSLARAIDARDAATRRHSERVADLAVAIAAELGWAPRRLEMLHEVGLVHDVGKIGVPDAVLLKPGALTADEYEQIKLHAALGAQIVAGVLTDEQTSWVRGHHEQIDGSGYPDGLQGDEIPEGARILALADAWDVMTVARHYRTPLTVAGALAECRRHSGRQFWTDAVDVLDQAIAAVAAKDDTGA